MHCYQTYSYYQLIYDYVFGICVLTQSYLIMIISSHTLRDDLLLFKTKVHTKKIYNYVMATDILCLNFVSLYKYYFKHISILLLYIIDNISTASLSMSESDKS